MECPRLRLPPGRTSHTLLDSLLPYIDNPKNYVYSIELHDYLLEIKCFSTTLIWIAKATSGVLPRMTSKLISEHLTHSPNTSWTKHEQDYK